MSVRTDVINLNVNVNGNQAQNQLNDLKKKAADIKNEMDGLKKGTQAYIDKKKELATVTGEMSNLKKQIGLTALTQKELIQELTSLKALKGSVTPFSQEFKDLENQIKKVESRLYDVKNGVQGFSSFFSKIKDEVKQFGMMAAAYLGFQFITQQFQNIIRGAGKLSDSLADIRRVTGMTADEVKSLNHHLSELDTRTSTEGLRNIAIVAGKLGVAKDDILEFVKATDMLVVALGDELGDADQITTQLGKIINVFDKGDGKVTGEKLSSIGNAIVDLANKGVASGGFIVDFTQRMAGLAKTANLSLDAVMGLAAGLEESGQKTESSSTAIIKVLSQMGQDVPKFAKVAGMSIEEFSKLMADKPVEALIKVSEGFTKGKNSFEDISKAFKDAGEDGAKIVTTLGVIGGKAEFFREKINATGDALKNTDEITGAFELKNQTLGSTLDKLGKEFNKLMTSSAITDFLKSAINGTMNFIKWLKDLPTWIDNNRTSLLLLSGIVLSYLAAKTKATQAIVLNKLATLADVAADRISAAQKAISIALTNAYAYAKDVLTGKIKLATVAQQIWNTVIKANPLAAFVAIVFAVAAAISWLHKKVTELSSIQKLQQDIQRKAADSYLDEEAKLRSLATVVGNSTISLEARKNALKELIDINPQYLSGLTLENIKTQEGINIINSYIKALREKATAQAATEVQAEKLKQDMKLQQVQYNLEKKIATGKTDISDLSEEEQGYVGSARKQFAFSASVTDMFTGENAAKEALNAIKAQRTKIQVELDQTDDIISKNYQKSVTNIDGSNAGKIQSTGTKVSRTINSIKKQIEDLEKAYGDIDTKDKKALKSNFDERKKLQQELDQLEGKEQKKTKEQKKEESEYSRLKKEAAQFAKDIKKLRQDVELDGKNADEKEIQRITDKYKELTDRALKYFQGHITTQKQFNDQEKELQDLFNQEMAALVNKRLEQQHAKEYEDALKYSAEFFEEQRNLAGSNYAVGLTDKNEYEASLRDIEKREANNRVVIAQDYSSTVKKAAEDVRKFKAEQEKLTTTDAIQSSEKRKELANQEALAEKKLAVLQARAHTDARLDADKDYLTKKFEIESESMDKTSEMYKLKKQELDDELGDMDKQATLDKIDNVLKYIGYFQDAMASLNAVITNRENRMLAEDRKRNDAKKKAYKGQLDNKLMSQAQYDLKINQLDEEQKRKETEARQKQAKREKAMAIFSALVNTAAAITKTFVEYGWPLGIPMAAAMAVTGGLQVAAIASQPLPELGTGDWIRTGAKHRDKEGGIPVMIERDEAVMKADAMTDPNTYTVTGTTAQITSALNSRAGGVNWAGGAVLQMPRWRTERPASINPNMPRIMEQGGIIRPIDGKSTDSTRDEQAGLLRQLISEQQQSREEMKNWKNSLKAVVAIKDIDETRAKYDAAKKVSGLNQ